MTVRSGQPFTLRDLFDRFSLIASSRSSGVWIVTAGLVSIAGGILLRCSEFGPYCRTSPGAAQFICATGPNGSAAFAQIAGRIPRMRALMNWASAGMHRYPTASGAGGRA
jgi:hypothetical protein